MWRKAFLQPGGIGAAVCGIIAWNVTWYFDFGERAIWLSGVAGYITATFMMWMDMTTNRLWRIEKKLDDIESKLDDIESKPDSRSREAGAGVEAEEGAGSRKARR